MPKGERAKGESAQVGESAQEGESAQGRECPRGQECPGESAKDDGTQAVCEGYDGIHNGHKCNGHKIRLHWRMTALESRKSTRKSKRRLQLTESRWTTRGSLLTESRMHSSIPRRRGLVQAQLGPMVDTQQQKPCVWKLIQLPREGSM